MTVLQHLVIFHTNFDTHCLLKPNLQTRNSAVTAVCLIVPENFEKLSLYKCIYCLNTILVKFSPSDVMK